MYTLQEVIMDNVKIVVGANFGDEGKGKMVSYFANLANKDSAIVVRYNGGAQAAHRVKLPNGKFHVFGHIGSGAGFGIPTFLYRDFVLNPILFRVELKAFSEAMGKAEYPVVIIDYDHLAVTTPWDMKYNQHVERLRGDSRHGSCGVGIHATIDRTYSKGAYPTPLVKLAADTNTSTFKTIVEWYRRKVSINAQDALVDLVHNDPIFDINSMQFKELCGVFENDCRYMLSYCRFSSIECLYNMEDVIFEGAQGLAISSHLAKGSNRTPSNAGAATPLHILSALQARRIGMESPDTTSLNVEIVYVTRSYLTRHGAGGLPGEINKKALFSSKDPDPGNPENEFQGSMRYAPFTISSEQDMLNRIHADGDRDLSAYSSLYGCMHPLDANVSIGLAVTCCDQHTVTFSDKAESFVRYRSYCDGYTLLEDDHRITLGDTNV